MPRISETAWQLVRPRRPEGRPALAVTDQGSGDPPLVLVHGAGTSRAVWHRAQPLLAASRRVVAPDVPGYGDSAAAGRGFAMEEVADALADGLRHHDVGPFDLVGHSLGGALSIVFAARHPESVRRLVLVAPAGLAAIWSPAAAALGAVAAPVAAARRLASPLAGVPLVRRVALAGIARDGARVPAEAARRSLRSSTGAVRLHAGLASAAATDLRATLAAYEGPLGVIWGANDPVVPLGRLAILTALRPDRVLRVLPDAGHAPMLEHPRAFSDALDAVLSAL